MTETNKMLRFLITRGPPIQRLPTTEVGWLELILKRADCEGVGPEYITPEVIDGETVRKLNEVIDRINLMNEVG